MISRKLIVTAIQYELSKFKSFDVFAHRCEAYVSESSLANSEWVLFPELFAAELLNGDNRSAQIHELIHHLNDLRSLFNTLSSKFNCNIIAGTWISSSCGKYYHTSEIFLSDGSSVVQHKINLNATERDHWSLHNGHELMIIDSNGVRAAVLICSDIEHYDLAQQARISDVDIIFCPTSTATIHGYDRIRYCAHARAIEAGCYVVTACTVGSLGGVDFLEKHCGAANVIAPSDASLGFRANLACGKYNQGMSVNAVLSIDKIRRFKSQVVKPDKTIQFHQP